MTDLQAKAYQAAGGVEYPAIGKSLGELKLVQATAEGERVTVAVDLPSPFDGEDLPRRVEQAVKSACGVRDVVVQTRLLVQGRAVASDDPVPGVKNLVMVLSGKGGVGKSTTAVNLAVALARAGASVGLLDADMYGPSIPLMLGATGRPTSSDGKHIDPLERFGLKLMSLGFLLEDDRTAVIWRGPMLHGALVQFVEDVAWGKLDYLVVDLPPGTGDVALTLAQKAPTTGSVIVTTPQEVALADVYKSVAMCQKVRIPVLGVVENMGSFVCPHCSHESVIFGQGGGQKVADFARAPLLGHVPIDPAVRESGDGGVPVVLSAPDSGVARAFVSIAARLADVITKLHFDRKGHLGEVKQPVRLPVLR